MARSATLGNGTILVGLDYRGQVRDFYAPYVGHSNHVSGASGNYVHRIGVFVDGALSWLDDSDWEISTGFLPDTVVSQLHAVNSRIGITLTSHDAVHNEKNIFLRTFTLTNEQSGPREVKIFFSQQFRISESRRGDTGFYDPRVNAIIHYKGHDAFLINATHNGKQFVDYNIGLFGIENKEGTFHDATDGILERNPIEHGSVDSVIGMTCNLVPKGHAEIHYWVCYGESVDAVHDLNAHVLTETPEALLESANDYWNAWIKKENNDVAPLSLAVQTLFNKSLLVMRVHTGNHGAVIASSDTDMLHHGRDTYSYVWPRDGAYIARAFESAGYENVAKLFYQFATKRIERDGYLMHKYRADGVLGSSWHPWMQHGVPQLPIQEDETAIIIFMLWRHYERTKDLEFIESVYNEFIEPAANFMGDFVEAEFGLPMSSYDLWEEKYGISTYTASCVYAALVAASKFANVLGKEEPARTYSAIAQRMRSGILQHLYDENTHMFLKHIVPQENGDPLIDHTVDVSSFFGPVYFGVIEHDDVRVRKALQVIEDRLRVHAHEPGYMRYEGDTYYTMREAGTPNPWVITTLWMAQYHIMTAETLDGLKAAEEILEWAATKAAKGGMLAEQMHPHTGEHLSTAPLVWSHAEFVTTTLDYVAKYKELSGADTLQDS